MNSKIKLITALLSLSFILSLTNCQKVEVDTKLEQLRETPEYYSKAQVKIGEDVSQEILGHLELITQNSMSVVYQNGKPSLYTGIINSRELVSGTINTNKEIVVNNKHNTKHAFKIDNGEHGSVTNLIVVKIGDNI